MMNHKIKREELTKRIREQHRKSIISANRNKVPNAKLYNISSYPYLQNIQNYRHLPHQYIPSPQQRSQLIENMVQILAPLPPYITQFARNQTNQQSQIIYKILQICYDCLNLNICLKQCSECLVELSTINEFHKYFASSQHFQVFMEHTIGGIIAQQLPNTQICVNCIYIIGNSFEDLARLREQTPNSHQNQQIQQIIIRYLQNMCANYPFYHDCILLLLWFFRNCFLVMIKIQKNENENENENENQGSMEIQNCRKTDSIKLCNQTIFVIKSLLITIASKIGVQEGAKKQYLQASMTQSLQLLSLIVTYFPILYSTDKNTPSLQYQLQNNNPLWHIDQALDVIISTKELIGNNIIADEISELANSLINLLYGLTDKSIQSTLCFWKNIKMVSIEKYCLMIASGLVAGSTCFQTLSKIIESIFLKQKLRTQLTTNFLLNFNIFFKTNKQIITNRHRRINLIKTLHEMLNNISHQEIKNIIAHKLLNMCNYSSRAPLTERRVFEQEIESYFSRFFVPILLNVLELVLIDMDYGNVGLGLQIILKMVENWEIQGEVVEEQVKQYGIDGRIIQICGENCPQNVFQLATNLSDLLHLE